MASDLVYVVHSELEIAHKLSNALLTADYKVVAMTNDEEAEAAISGHQFVLPDAILTPLGDLESGDSILIKLFNSNPLMEQIPVVVLAGDRGDERRRALRLGLLSVILPPYDDEEVALTTQLAIEKHRSEQLLFGSLAQLPVPDLLQTAEVGRRSGVITFQHMDKKGTVWLRDGMVVNAVIDGNWNGEEAVYRIALWDTGTFEANFCPVDVDERFAIHPSELLLEAMRRFDEGLMDGDEEEERTAVEDSPAERLGAALHMCLVLANAAAGYATVHMASRLVEERFESVRKALLPKHPELSLFRLSTGGTTALEAVPEESSPAACVNAVAAWVRQFFELQEAALAWRFSAKRLAGVVNPWRSELQLFELLELLGVGDGDDDGEAEDPAAEQGAEHQLPYGCFVVDREGEIESFGAWTTSARGPDPRALVGQSMAAVLPPQVAQSVRAGLRSIRESAEVAAGLHMDEVAVQWAGAEEQLRIAVIRSALPDRDLVVLSRIRDRQAIMSATLERDLFKGTLTDGGAMRILAANDDFLDAFDNLFARSLAHRRHEMLHRFGKKWGLRHALRVEQLVQHEYLMTLREVESQLAIEVLSGSVGVIGLGRFEADLNYRESGVVVIFHHHSPFVQRGGAASGGACSILAGFHAALLSYLAGRQLAARELVCAGHRVRPCVFVIATEERLTKLFTATTGSADQQLLERISTELSTSYEAKDRGKKR